MINHNRILCAREASHFASQGFLIKTNFIDPDTVSALQQAAEFLEQRGCDNDPAVTPYTTYLHQINSNTSGQNKPYFMESLPILSRAFDNIISCKYLWLLASRLLQNRKISYHNACLLFKAAYIGPKVQWHRDFMRNDLSCFNSSHLLRIFIPLDRFDSSNGAPMVYPGSHTIPERAAFLRFKNRYGTHPFPYTLCCNPGDIIIINPQIRHSSDANQSAQNRTNLLLQLRSYGSPVHTCKNRELWFGLDRTGIRAAQSPLKPVVKSPV